MTSPSRTYAIFLAGACIWCALIFFPVAQVVHQPAITSVAVAVDRAFASVCHQLDARSFHVLGIRLAVCIRCTAIYGGFLAGIFLWRAGARRAPRHPVLWWTCALVPMLLDVILDAAGVHASGELTRVVTGGWFGIIAGIVVTPLFMQACADLAPLIHHPPARAYESATE